MLMIIDFPYLRDNLKVISPHLELALSCESCVTEYYTVPPHLTVCITSVQRMYQDAFIVIVMPSNLDS